MTRSSTHALIAVLTVCAVCCTRWGPPLRPARLDPARVPTSLLVVLTDHRRFAVDHAGLMGDTLVGDTMGLTSTGRAVPVLVAIPLASIDSVSVRQFDRLGTAVVAMAGVAVLAVVLAQSVEEAAKKASAQEKESCHSGRINID